MKTAVVHLLALALLAPGYPEAGQPESGKYVESINCKTGPFRLRLPNSIQSVRSIRNLRSERVLKTEDWGTYKSEDRRLSFDGLRLDVVTFSHDISRFMVAAAIVSTPKWSIAGGFRVGNRAKDITDRFGTKRVSGENEIKFSGDTDTIRFRISNGKVAEIVYECYTG